MFCGDLISCFYVPCRYYNGLKQIRAPSKVNRHMVCVNVLYDCEVSVIQRNICVAGSI